MSISATVTSSFALASGEPYAGASTFTGDTLVHVDASIALNQTNEAVSCAFVAANVHLLFMVATANCTVKTNSTSAPDNTIALKANVPLIWDSTSSYFTNPIGTNVTVLYVTNTAATRLRIDVLTS